MTSLQVKADSVKTSVTSAATCTTTTVSTLSELLLSNPAAHDLPTITTRATTIGKCATQAKAGLARQKNKKCDPQDQRTRQNTTLSPTERSILATEVFNSALKALSNSPKAPPAVRPQPSPKELQQASARNALRRTSSLPQSPLQPRSLNRISSSPNISNRSGRPSCSSIHTSGQRAVAECARIALACLRSLEASKLACHNWPEWQLENGMSTLIAKLINTGLDDLALKEIRILKRRLDTTLLPKGNTLRSKPKTTEQAASVGPSLAELLVFESQPLEGALLGLAISTQMQALKLLAANRKPDLVASAYHTLKPQNFSSPTHLLLRFADQLPSNLEKARRQFETLTQLILSLTPSISISEDTAALESKLNVSADVALQLQSLVFRTRRLMWKACRHEGDVEAELLEPFFRCLAAFARRSSFDLKDRYKCAQEAFQNLFDGKADGLNKLKPGSKSVISSIYQLLSNIAQDAGCDEDAILWIGKLKHVVGEAKISEIRRCAVAARLISLKLRVKPNDQEVDELLMTLLTGLEGSLSGELGELDELIGEVSQARRAAIQLLSRRKPGSNAIGDLDVKDSIFQMCESLIFQCPRFSLRYLGVHPGDETLTKDIVRYEQRRHILAKLAPNMLDSAFFLVKVLQNESRLTWDLIDSVLSNCLTILEVVDSDLPTSTDSQEAARVSNYVRISNLYFTQHLNLRREAETHKDSKPLKALQRSVEAVKGRPVFEKKLSLLTMKLERMADMLKELGRLDDAADSIRWLCNELIANGVLNLVGAKAGLGSFRSAWNQDDDTTMLSRATASLIKLEMKNGIRILSQIPFSDSSWLVEDKGAMLEHVLAVLCRQSTSASHFLKHIIKDLLEVYDSKSFPIRRLRVLTYILRHGGDQHRNVIDDVKTAITFACIQDIVEQSQDSNLSSSLPHLLSLASITLELLEDHPRIDLITPHLAVWYSIVRLSKDFSSLSSKIDDFSDFMIQLDSIADFLDMKGFGKTRAAVLRMIANIHEIPRTQVFPDEKLLSYAHLAWQYLDLGYSGKAGLALDRAQICASQNGVTPRALLTLQVSHANYLLKIGNVDKCEEVLSRAQTLAGQLTSDSAASKANMPSVDLNLIAEACMVHSLLSLERGHLLGALWHAKQSLRLMSKSWACTEQQAKRNSIKDKHIESVSDDSSNFSLSNIASSTVSDLQEEGIGPAAWGLVRQMFQGMLYLSNLYANTGMFQETYYYADQALKFVSAAGCSNLIAAALTATGSAWLRAGMSEKALQQLIQARELCSTSKEGYLPVTLNCHLGKLYLSKGEGSAALAACEDAQLAVERLGDPEYVSNFDQIIDSASILQAELSRLSLGQNRCPVSKRATSRKNAIAKKTSIRPKLHTDMFRSTFNECIELASLRGLVLRQKSRAMLTLKRFDEAADLLREAGSHSHGRFDAIDHQLSLARQLFRQGMEQLNADPVFSVLQDSTISFPAIVSASRLTTSVSERISGVRLSPNQHSHGISSHGAGRSKSPSGDNLFEKLKQAQDYLLEAQSMAVQVSSTTIIQTIASVLAAITILLSASGPGKTKSLVHPGFTACSIEMARTRAIERQRIAVAPPPEQLYDDFHWPKFISTDPKRSSIGISSDISLFQKDFIDIIPQSWTAISISLSENRQDLCLTRFERGHRPFILRLPLGRNNSRDADEEVFDYEQGKNELHEIIDLANVSAHNAQDLIVRGAKDEWWAQRDALDQRLKELLENIEKVWLGGFKGIFSQHPKQPDVLARFQLSFQSILDKHLPSRQKTSKRSKVPRICLDPRILELFIGLGPDFIERGDLDELLTDLMYFVVDVLQHHGESNAYDEIDFDCIAIEIQDALRCYHEAVEADPSGIESRHTILILDKALHEFPWESLPCMDGQAVSRLPSLGCLRERLVDQENRSKSTKSEGHYIDMERGAYVLNPGGDLKATQKSFERGLNGLNDWEGIVDRIPTETEMKESLESKDLFLYFGHGSGDQYIRSKTIKRLENCAVTFLMGCSSGAVTDAGEFEPYGPPMNYLLAGCPAVVATLWDVTDKDIDRFAKSTFEHWGLFKSRASGSDQVIMSRGKKTAEQKSENAKLSLVAAVAAGRRACNLRYLTAAAVCVYGIPVYFK